MPTNDDVIGYNQINIGQSGDAGGFDGLYLPSPRPADGKSRSFYRAPPATGNAHFTILAGTQDFVAFHISFDINNKNAAVWYNYNADKQNLSRNINTINLPYAEAQQFNQLFTSAVEAATDRMALEFYGSAWDYKGLKPIVYDTASGKPTAYDVW